MVSLLKRLSNRRRKNRHGDNIRTNTRLSDASGTEASSPTQEKCYTEDDVANMKIAMYFEVKRLLEERLRRTGTIRSTASHSQNESLSSLRTIKMPSGEEPENKAACSCMDANEVRKGQVMEMVMRFEGGFSIKSTVGQFNEGGSMVVLTQGGDSIKCIFNKSGGFEGIGFNSNDEGNDMNALEILLGALFLEIGLCVVIIVVRFIFRQFADSFCSLAAAVM